MNSKQRVTAAFAFETPDRVPINYLANPGIDERLKRHFRLSSADDEELRVALGVDFRNASPRYVGPPLHEEKDGVRVGIWGAHTRWVEHGSGGYWDYCEWPLSDATVEEIRAWPMPSPDDFDYDEALVRADASKEYYVTIGGPGVGDIINSTSMVRTMEQVLVDLVTDAPHSRAYYERKCDIQLEVMSRVLDRAQGKVDMLWLGEDLGTQIGQLISLDLYRRAIRPQQQRFVDLAAAYGIPTMIHSCGSSSWAFEDYIEMGVRVVDTLQPEAVDMSPELLKSRYGGRLAFHGAISTAGPVATGTVEEARSSVRGVLDVMMPGSGYAFAPTHALQDNSPTENVVAAYDVARTYGRY
jgi:hypothetical protein